MNTAVELFQYETNQIRTVDLPRGRWAVASDICRALDIKNVSDAVSRLDAADVGSTDIRSGGQVRKVTIVSEGGATDLVLDSRKPEARAFRRWLTHEVWPAIRETGSYSAAPALTGAELLAHAVLEAQSMIAAKDEQIAELAPKAEIADAYLLADGGSRLVGQAAKLLGMKERELRAFLLAEQLIFTRHAPCGNVQYDHYAQFAHHFQATEHIVNHTWGSCSHYTLRILPRGMELIQKRRRKLALTT